MKTYLKNVASRVLNVHVRVKKGISMFLLLSACVLLLIIGIVTYIPMYVFLGKTVFDYKWIDKIADRVVDILYT